MELKQSEPYNPYKELDGRIVRYVAQNSTWVGKVGFRYDGVQLDSITFSPAIDHNANGRAHSIDGPIISTIIAGVMVPYEKSRTIEGIVGEINEEIDKRERDKKAQSP